MISSTGSVASIFETAMAASLWLYPSETSRDGQRHPVRLHHAQDGKAHLGAHARNSGQHLKAGLLLLGGKAVEADIVLRHAHHSVQGRFFSHAGQRPGHAGRALGVVAHPAAADHHRVHGLFDDFSG